MEENLFDSSVLEISIAGWRCSPIILKKSYEISIEPSYVSLETENEVCLPVDLVILIIITFIIIQVAVVGLSEPLNGRKFIWLQCFRN